MTQGLAAMCKSWRFSVVAHLGITIQKASPSEDQILNMFTNAVNKYVPRLVCLASVRTISRIGDQSLHFRMLSSDLIIRVAQTLGWFIDLKGTLRMLEKRAD